jgi:hypothetical protein
VGKVLAVAVGDLEGRDLKEQEVLVVLAEMVLHHLFPDRLLHIQEVVEVVEIRRSLEEREEREAQAVEEMGLRAAT